MLLAVEDGLAVAAAAQRGTDAAVIPVAAFQVFDLLKAVCACQRQQVEGPGPASVLESGASALEARGTPGDRAACEQVRKEVDQQSHVPHPLAPVWPPASQASQPDAFSARAGTSCPVWSPASQALQPDACRRGRGPRARSTPL